MIRRLFAFLKRDWKTIIKFIFVGGTSFVLYAGIYTLQSRVLFPGAPDEARLLMNIVATCFSVLFNYLAHRFWTYGAKEASVQQVAWYAFVVGSATVLQSVIFWLGHVVLGVYDYFVIVFAAGLCAFYTFVMHKYLTFGKRKDPLRVLDSVEG